MTSQQVENLNLGISPVDIRTTLMIESAFHWINDHTILNIDFNSDEALALLPANVKLFVIKYFDVMNMPTGVSSESIEGLSQRFDTSNKSDLLWQYAYELFGDRLKPQMSFTSAKKKWR